MNNFDLINAAQFDLASGVSAAATATVSTAIYDMQGYDGIVFVAQLGTCGGTGTVSLAVQSGPSNSATGMVTITNAAQGAVSAANTTFAAGGATSAVLVTDCKKPLNRYVRAQVVTATANTAISGVIAIRYLASKKPVSQSGVTATGRCIGA